MTSSSNRGTLERIARRVPIPEPAYDRLLRRRDRKRRNQRIAAGVVAIALFLVPVALFAALVLRGPDTRPAGPAAEPRSPGRVRGAPPPAQDVPKADYFLDLNTGVMTPLPESIIRTAGETAEAEATWPAWLRTPNFCSGARCGDAGYVASPDGSQLAYVGTGDEGRPQIFVASIDGTGIRQMTHDPAGAVWPAWSPDGTLIAYARITEIPWRFAGIFVLDVATGESTQVPEGSFVGGPQFTPDGASLLYEDFGARNDCPISVGCGHLRTVPIAGGPSTVLIGPGTDVWEVLSSVWNGSLSPDGSLVTFTGTRPSQDVTRWVANANGTGLRELPGCYDAIEGGTWSPDGSRIVCNESVPPTYAVIMVIDVATGDARRVARGVAATWLDDHTLLVEG
jgi:hypothetical protein